MGAPKGGSPKGGSPEGWGPEGWGPEGWGPEGWSPEGWGAQNFALFFPSPATKFSVLPSLGVEFWWCLKRRDAQMCAFGVQVYVKNKCIYIYIYMLLLVSATFRSEPSRKTVDFGTDFSSRLFFSFFFFFFFFFFSFFLVPLCTLGPKT